MADQLAATATRNEEPLLAVRPQIPWVRYVHTLSGLSLCTVIPPLLAIILVIVLVSIVTGHNLN